MKREAENKMRRLFCGGAWAVALMLCGTLSMLTFTACSDDDDGSYDLSNTIIETEDGDKLQVTRVGSTYYGYDDDGYLNYFKWEGDEYEGSNNATKFTLPEDDEDYEMEISLSYNGSGYISKVIDKGSDYYDDDEYDSWEESASLSYDGSGHLTKVSWSGKYTEVWDGDKDSYSSSGSITLTWSNGLLTKCVYKEDDYSEIYEYDYDDGLYLNAYCQHTPSTLGLDLLFEAFTYTGLCGKGPNYLPVTRTFTEVDYEDGEEDYSYTSTTTYKYGFNSDGTIDYQCLSSGKSYQYFEYANADSYASSRASGIEEESESTDKSRRMGLFGRVSKHQRETATTAIPIND